MIEIDVVIERTKRSYGAFVRNEGVHVVATGKSRKQVIARIESGLSAWFGKGEQIHVVYSDESTLQAVG